MSEINNTPADGIPEVTFEVEVSNVVQTPVDDTLSIAGMAADAKATGDAIVAAKAELQEEIDAIDTDVSGVYGRMFPSGQSMFQRPQPRRPSGKPIGIGRKS